MTGTGYEPVGSMGVTGLAGIGDSPVLGGVGGNGLRISAYDDAALAIITEKINAETMYFFISPSIR